MSDRRKKLTISVIFWFVVYVFMMIALARLFTRQVLVKKFHLDNGVVHFVYGKQDILQNEAAVYAGNSISSAIDWKDIYPYAIEDEQTSELPDELAGKDPDLSLANKNSFIDNYVAKADELKNDVSNYVEEYHPVPTYMKWITGAYDMLIMGRKAALAVEGIYVARDKWLYDYVEDQEEVTISDNTIDELADNVEDLYDYLQNNDIGFLYASIGLKPCPWDDSIPTPLPGEKSINKRFIKKLSDRGIPVYDMSAMMPRDPGKWYNLWYQTDMHWNYRGGLWAAGVLASYLNDNCGFSFDLDMFNEDSYIEITRENYFKGTLCRRVSPLLTDKEPLTKLIPRSDIQYHANHYYSGGLEEREGCFDDVFFNNDVYETMATYSPNDFYDSSLGDFKFIQNDPLFTFINEVTPDNKGKKILLIRDSFAGYVAPFISTDVREIDLIYKPKFNGSLKAYVEDTKPDAVIMMLYEGTIHDDTSEYDYFFDLR